MKLRSGICGSAGNNSCTVNVLINTRIWTELTCFCSSVCGFFINLGCAGEYAVSLCLKLCINSINLFCDNSCAVCVLINTRIKTELTCFCGSVCSFFINLGCAGEYAASFFLKVCAIVNSLFGNDSYAISILINTRIKLEIVILIGRNFIFIIGSIIFIVLAIFITIGCLSNGGNYCLNGL